MKLFKTIATTTLALALATPALAHQTGLPHPHEGVVAHSVFGVDHLLILLAVIAIGAVIAWRSR